MADDTVTIEVDGVSLKARKGEMLIRVTDAHGIYVPRFCYHEKLSVAANCRMCLVEVEKAPKPLPACATPVMDGMKVRTKSKLALEAQKSVMEFLLINHPLDCPICDQGGECELQDLAMGFGRDVSRFQEGKRVVKDKNIGPLVHTDMTRCIHCTRCVRFGEEIAGLRELGATGRGEFMEIGTFVEQAMNSELSGNVIDLCPVGALTSKPFRYSARTWEMTQHPGIAPHDGVGSNVHFHVKDDRVMRVVPAENETINEVWLSDRDRFSYEGMYSGDRLTAPMVREADDWREVDWETAFRMIQARLGGLIESRGASGVGGLISPTATSEELFLFQKFLRALGTNHIDHRLRQLDFSDQKKAPVFPWLGQAIVDLERLDAALVIGGHPRKDQPLLNHRLRKAALRGAKIMFVNPVGFESNFRVDAEVNVQPARLCHALAGILKSLREGRQPDPELDELLAGIEASEEDGRIARQLAAAGRSSVLLGNLAAGMPDFAVLRYLAGKIAAASGSTFGYLGEAANSAGAWLAGAVPHRAPGGKPVPSSGLHALAMLDARLPVYILFNVEPESDCAYALAALTALEQAECVIAMTPFRSAQAERSAHFLLPSAIYAENEGSYVNVEGRAQETACVVGAPGEARPGWKILRMLADRFGLDGFAYDAVADITKEFRGILEQVKPDNVNAWKQADGLPVVSASLQRVTRVPTNSADALVRRAPALQLTPDRADGKLHLNRGTAQRLGIVDVSEVVVAQDGSEAQMEWVVDEHVPDGAVLIQGGQPALAWLGPWFGEIAVRRE
ncbi:MAG: NADH-quinone oxidoreductase subunit NuoG [Burkholderiales bacterium]